MNNTLSLIENVDVQGVSATFQKIAQFQVAVQKTLKKDHDYGVIPGCNKPTLLKPGAEKILMLMGVTSEYNIIEKVEDYDNGVFAYTIKCELLKGNQKITDGLGSCNSKEDKYRWRWVDEKDLPNGVDKETLKYRSKSYGGNTYTKYRIENDDICSQANTILKMAKKRAQIDATLTIASLSEIFTQDIEDLKDFNDSEISTMTVEEATEIKLSFGKYKGRTLGDVYKSDYSYIEYLLDKSQDKRIIKACEVLQQATNEDKKSNNTMQNKEAS